MNPTVKEFDEKLAQCKTYSIRKFNENHCQNEAYSKAIRGETCQN